MIIREIGIAVSILIRLPVCAVLLLFQFRIDIAVYLLRVGGGFCYCGRVRLYKLMLRKLVAPVNGIDILERPSNSLIHKLLRVNFCIKERKTGHHTEENCIIQVAYSDTIGALWQ